MKVREAMEGAGMMQVICQQWEESERGWGVRPDGYSLHRDQASLDAYLKRYWDEMPKLVPDEYERPCGHAYAVYVNKGVYEDLQAKDGMRFYSGGSPEPNEVVEVK